MSGIDFTDYNDLIPEKTIAVTEMRLRFGDAIDGVLKRTKGGDGEGLDAEFTIVEGPHARRKFFAFMLVEGSTDGQKSMSDRNKAMLKRIVDSARYLDPNDKSPEIRARRTMVWRDFDGMRFLAEIGIEAGRNGYPDKNVIARVITKDRPEWAGRPPIDQASPDYGPTPAQAPPLPVGPAAATAAPAPVSKPKWAQ